MSVNKLNLFNKYLFYSLILVQLGMVKAEAKVDSYEPKPSLSKVKRISGVLLNTGEVLAIYVSPGLATLIEASCPILEATVGNPKDISRELSDKNPNTVRIFLSTAFSMSSNLIIQCQNEVIVLDLYPSRTTHQDYLKIEGTYGGPELSETSLKLIELKNEGTFLNEKKLSQPLILIQEGGGKLSLSNRK